MTQHAGDRDLVVPVVAESRGPNTTTAANACGDGLLTPGSEGISTARPHQ
ncbi:hypothetical protein [Streptomyces sp. KMM 9044]|nr:hypothetical protein [Streptomyces sp. KMM 9044]WAX81495.1 hypothetical protein HUV60_031600 [Streptomyces sp. KMM 9044]